MRDAALSFIERPVDRVLVSINETLRSFTHEAWQVSSQFANGVSVALLGLVHKPAVNNYFENRHRIHQIDPRDSLGGVSPFADVVKNYAAKEESSNSEGEEEDVPTPTHAIRAARKKKPLKGDRRVRRQFLNTTQPDLRASAKKVRRSISEPDLLSMNGEWDELGVPDDIAVNGVTPTGLFEDIRLFQLQVINFIMSQIRWLWHSGIGIAERFNVVSLFSWSMLFAPFFALKSLAEHTGRCLQAILWALQSCFHPSQYLTKQGIDNRSKEEIVRESGYPYELHTVTTKDGYIITLERLPHPQSRRALYFQHGVIDSGFTWLASGNSTSLAMAAYDKGYDVFLGNFRGNEPTSHVNPDISNAEYWDFNVNDHAWKDMPAFVQYIQELKKKELNIPLSEEIDGRFTITAVAHSMGGMATLMYMIKSGLDGTPHGLSKAVLLSPAGIHKDSPPLAKIGAPLLDYGLRLLPFIHTLRFPSNLMRIISSKVMEDVKSTNPTRDLFTYVATMLIGGSVEDHSLNRVNIVRWVFTGTAVGVFRHFRQLISSKRFRAYDYGRQRNMKEYGTPTPLHLDEHYDQLDIPVYYMMGLIDNLIRPANVIAHFDAHSKHNPHQAFLKAFADAGHVEFTLGVSEEMTNVILSCLNDSKDETVTVHSINPDNEDVSLDVDV